MDSEQLDLGAKCTIIRAEELHAQMETILHSGQDVEIDASKVEQVDTSALQLLLSFHQALSNDGRHIKWNAPSESLLKTAKLLGIDNQLTLKSH